MNKRTCTLIGVHALAIAGIATGYYCMYKKTKRPKLTINGLGQDF